MSHRIEYMIELIMSDDRIYSVGRLLGILLNDCPVSRAEVELTLNKLAAENKVENLYGNEWRQK
jgi:hypothetical protein